MPLSRRNFIKNSIAASIIGASSSAFANTSESNKVIKPAALKRGDTIGIVCPAYSAFVREEVQIAVESLQELGFKVKIGSHVFDRYGYLAGNDADRSVDINNMFGDKTVQGILAMHGGWGCARLLHLLDYERIKANPKVIVGYSDVTALLLGIHAQTNMVTVHGPVGSSTWNSFSVNYFQHVLMNAQAVSMSNPGKKTDTLVQTQNRITTITPGEATGKLIGGNLTVLTSILGSAYMPDCRDAILFLEDVNEDIYRVDRMITHLKLAGILDQIKGFVFGKCTECMPSKGGYGSLTLEDIWRDHIMPLNIPAFAGTMIGHIEDKFTVPIGVQATINANSGTIKLNESAVVK